MCGITGFYHFIEGPVLEKELERSVQKLKHRGPDQQVYKHYTKAGVGHTRLSVIDLTPDASQPMMSEDGSFSVVFNGEIYNYKVLRTRLALRGAKFKTQSDTEVILRGFELMGEGIFELLYGMFAIAIYDSKRHQLILARDRFGIKPLYLYKDDKSVYFASEMGALLEYPIERKLNKQAVSQFFRFNYIPDNNSIIENISQLRPGTYRIFKKDEQIEYPYYSINSLTQKIEYKEALERIRVLIEQSVKERLIADVPVGSFLSGGIDSSIIASLAKKHSDQIKTFSAGFNLHRFFDESNDARKFANDIRTDHFEFDLDRYSIAEEADHILDAFSEPFADTSAIAYYLLSKSTSEQTRVVLSGDGADEVFGGYKKHRAEWLVQNNPKLAKASGLLNFSINDKSASRNSLFGNQKRQIKKWMQGVRLNNYDRYLLWASIQSETEVQSLLNFDSNGYVLHLPGIRDFNDVLECDMQFVLPGDMLTKADRMSMQFGLEVRTPFLDHFLVDFVFSLPAKWKMKRGIQKKLLIQSIGHEIPPYVLKRKKRGFEVPLWDWLQGPLRSLMMDCIQSDAIQKSGLFNTDYVDYLVKKALSESPGDAPSTVWAIMVFSRWLTQYKPTY